MKMHCFIFCSMYLCASAGAQAVRAPLSLASAIEIGLANNPEIKSAEQQIQASKGRFRSAVSLPPPEVSLTHDYVPLDKGLGGFGEKTVGISQSFEFPTTYFIRGSKYSREEEISRQEFALTKYAVISRIKSAYFTAAARREHVDIARENLAIAEDFAQKATIRFEAGEGTNLEKLTARVQRTEAINAADISANLLATALAELNFVLGYGKNESQAFHLTDTFRFAPLDIALDTLVAEAARNNPGILMQKLRVDASSAEKSLAWSGLLPNITIGYFSKQVREDARDYYGASIGFSVPLWFAMDQGGKIKEASALARSAEYDLRTAQNAVYLKLSGLYREFTNEKKQVLLHEREIIPQAQEIFRTARKSYEAGEITYIEFLQARQTMVGSRKNFIDALLAYNLSLVALEEAVGKTLQ